ncbi:AraC family transcriptional regulator [Nocardia vaccinii]|uniref:AraC family transcriptional regulator n=1 Tax=Nocardia vaccinii TaxID=1822 RepID=UPI001C3F94CB|nr:AraC family transcriptional regulator [Nocardia vaccinii]
MTEAVDLPPHHYAVPATHAHDFLQLVYIEDGRHCLRVEDRDWHLTTGDAFVIAPGTVINAHHTHTDSDTKMWMVLFSADAVEPAATTLLTSWRAHPLLSSFAGTGRGAHRVEVPHEDRWTWHMHLAGLRSELRHRRDGYADAIRAHLTLLLIQLSRLDLDIPFDLDRDSVLAAVFDAIETRYQEPISLNVIAVAVAQSPGHLAAIIKQRTGRTVGQWITERRMREARRLLADTDRPISEIAARIGYRDPGYFTRKFHAENQMAPQAWRQAGRQSP